MEILNVVGIQSRPERSYNVLEQVSEKYASQVRSVLWTVFV